MEETSQILFLSASCLTSLREAAPTTTLSDHLPPAWLLSVVETLPAALKLKRFSSKALKSVCYNWTTTQLSCRALYEKSRRWSFWWR
ncbi:hypothetical protein [Nostoc sp.]|uniref:hypothetical protein n=1 Tax=Nostoc sp. TaxID=1180 RepID=UPI002FF6A8B6